MAVDYSLSLRRLAAGDAEIPSASPLALQELPSNEEPAFMLVDVINGADVMTSTRMALQ